MNRLPVLVTVLVSGLLFGLGLVVSDMASPERVIAFLQIDATWDATLAWVMASALAISLPGFWLAQRLGKPLLGEAFPPKPATVIDRPLLIGAVFFGLGWGLSGYCPGPVLVGAGLGISNALIFVPAMLVGAWVADRVTDRG